MKKFSLKTKLGERLYSVDAHDIIEAREKFAVIKKLGISDLLLIFIVEQEGK
jgi:hypothetical protein